MDAIAEPAKILLVDANAAELERLSAAVRAAGHLPFPVQSAGDALDSIARLLPDLVLVGACSADGDTGPSRSAALLETLRPWFIPMIVIYEGEADDLPALFAAGAADCLARNASGVELRARLHTHLSRGRLALQVEQNARRLALANQEKVALQQRLSESEERFDRIAETAIDAIIIIDCEGRVLLWNASAERIFGYAKEEVAGRDLHAILAPFAADRPQPHDFNNLYITHTAQGPAPITEFQSARKDGSRITIELARSPAAIAGQPVMLGIARDITERKRLLHLIEKGKREWEALVDAIDDLILLAGPDGRVLRCNRAAMTRLTRHVAAHSNPTPADPWNAVLRQTPGALLYGAPDGDERLARLEAELAPGQEIQFPRLEGWFEVNIYPVSAGEGDQKAYLLKDVTQRKIMEAAMRASQKMASLGTLVAGVAHEINSPLQVITGVSESLLNQCRNGGAPAERLERNLTMIRRNGARVAGLVRALRLYAHTSDEIFRPDHLNEIVADTLLLIEHQLQSWSNIHVRTDLAPDLPELECDREKLAQALINLLTNARDAMPAGGEIAIVTRYHPAPDELSLSISDDGQGIPAEIQAKVFDPFFTTKSLGQGTGLGLSVVLGVVQTHHGRIALHSVIKEGTRFDIVFPRLQPPPEAVQTRAPLQTSGRFDQV